MRRINANILGLPVQQATNVNQKTWSELMLDDYVLKNAHYPYSVDEKALILSRLEEEYVVTTFGPDGANKTICDFFIFLQTTNATTALTTRTVTKTGATLRWNYGAGNVYAANNLPAQICNGVISVTSADGFSGLTVLNLHVNAFIGALPPLSIMVNIATLSVYQNAFSGGIPDWSLCTKLFRFDFSDCSITGAIPSVSHMPDLDYILGQYNKLTGDFPDFSLNQKLRLIRVMNAVSGDKLNIIENIAFTVLNPLLAEINLKGCCLSVENIDILINKIAVYYSTHTPTVNLLIDISNISATAGYNGYITGGEANVDVIALKAAFVSASKTLTLNYNNTESSALTSGMVAFTCDDGYGSQFSLARPLFLARSKRFTMFMTSGAAYPSTDKISWANALTMQSEGFYVGGHSETHVNYVTLTEAQLRSQLVNSDASFLANGLTSPIRHEAYPFGHNGVNETIIDDYRLSARDTTAGMVVKTSNLFRLYNASIDSLTFSNIRLTYVKILWAKNAKIALIPMFHMVKTEYGIATSIHIDILTALLDYAISIGVNVVTIPELYAELTA